MYQGPERELSGFLIDVPGAICYKLFLVSWAVPPVSTGGLSHGQFPLLSPQVGGYPGVYIYSGPIYSGHHGGCFMLVILCRIIGTSSGFLGREVATVNYTSTSINNFYPSVASFLLKPIIHPLRFICVANKVERESTAYVREATALTQERAGNREIIRILTGGSVECVNVTPHCPFHPTATAIRFGAAGTAPNAPSFRTHL